MRGVVGRERRPGSIWMQSRASTPPETPTRPSVPWWLVPAPEIESAEALLTRLFHGEVRGAAGPVRDFRDFRDSKFSVLQVFGQGYGLLV